MYTIACLLNRFVEVKTLTFKSVPHNNMPSISCFLYRCFVDESYSGQPTLLPPSLTHLNNDVRSRVTFIRTKSMIESISPVSNLRKDGERGYSYESILSLFFKILRNVMIIVSIHYITKFWEDYDEQFYDNHYLFSLRSLELVVSWILFTIFLLFSVFNYVNKGIQIDKVIIIIPVIIYCCIIFALLIYYQINMTEFNALYNWLDCNVFKCQHAHYYDIIHDVCGVTFVLISSVATLYVYYNFCSNCSCCDNSFKLRKHNKQQETKDMELALMQDADTDGDIQGDDDHNDSNSGYHSEYSSDLSRFGSTYGSSNIWLILVIFIIFLFLFLCGMYFIGYYAKISKYYEQWILILIIYTSIFKLIFKNTGRIIDTYIIKHKLNPQNELSVEIMFEVLIQSVYFVIYRVYMVYAVPTWLQFFVGKFFHLLSEVMESYVKASRWYFTITFYMMKKIESSGWIDRRRNSLFNAFLSDVSSIEIWQERVCLDSVIRMIISYLSVICVALLYVDEYFAYSWAKNAANKSKDYKNAAKYLGMTLVIETLLFIALWHSWLGGKGHYTSSFRRYVSRNKHYHLFLWWFAATYALGGLTYAGKNV